MTNIALSIEGTLKYVINKFHWTSQANSPVNALPYLAWKHLSSYT